ncbi:uncharacterized protein LOC8283311 [Ricinus communis]|uniref:Uncharacterized protein n=1 Tax=Ricinus communis TaxID=3988 RepID=B9S7B4_RICCO|nr:uncharacterized protein LOC8283311 [Ricinus communis]EEF40519.1 conserved hypothetical protein [Ricinus communis]|eukprot:XP_002521883.1 uncharacterized protein LOC8283311 [Ricinus communis]
MAEDERKKLESVPKSEREEAVKEKEKESMKPWEQHAAIISIPRFDYNAPSALLHNSHSGFLITCSIKREKSATKEVMSILEKYIGSYTKDSSNGSQGIKRRKTLMGGTCAQGMESKDVSEDPDQVSEETHTVEETGFTLSLVKLTRSGLLLLNFVGENSPDATEIVSNIFQRIESGSLKSPLWCHRIFPIQATCCLDEKELRTVVSKLVLRFINDKANKFERPIKYAVGYNRRGIEETQAKNVKDTSKDSALCSLLDRNKCFDVVASAVKDVISDSAVDLKSPELSILVELLPLSGVPNGSLVAAVSVLPQNLVSVKPRLCIKPLVSDANAKKGRR